MGRPRDRLNRPQAPILDEGTTQTQLREVGLANAVMTAGG